MRYTECANGHVYDADQYAVCPYCNHIRTEIQFGPGGGQTVAPGGGSGTVAPSGFGPAPGGATVAPGGLGGSPLDGERIMPTGGGEDSQKTVAPDMFRKQAEQSNKTVAVFRQRHGIDPVVGWLVCVNGPEKGNDYRLKAKINTIGRGEGNDVCINGDKTISSHAHAKLAYDARRNQYTFLPGEGSNINYLNNEAVYTPMPLHAYDVVDLGESSFLFIPLCDERFRWDGASQG